MQIGRENPADPNEDFCMTVLGLRISRRANAVSALHGRVTRAMWKGLYPGKPEDSVPIGHITNGVHVPTWLAPQMFRLYDRHLGTGWHQHSSEPRIWEGIENVDDGELWETHLSLKRGSWNMSPPRRRTIDAPRRTARSPAAAGPRAQPGRADHRICAALCNLQTRQPDFDGHGKTGRPWSTTRNGRCNSFSPARRTRTTSPASACCSRSRSLMRDSQFADKFVFVEDYDINVGRHFVQGVDVWLNNPRRPLEASGTSGQKVVLERRTEPLRPRWLVGRGLRRDERLRHRHGPNALQHERARLARRRRPVARAARRGDSSVLPARSRRPAARLDQAHEAHHPHARLALQRRPHGDGLHAQVLRAGGGRTSSDMRPNM